MKTITPELIEKTKIWLGDEGINFFREMKEKHGKFNATFLDGGIPHMVHFREGMQVRNFMIDSGFCKQCNSCKEYCLDQLWIELIEVCIK